METSCVAKMNHLFTCSTDASGFHRLFKDIQGVREDSIFTQRTDAASAEQYFQVSGDTNISLFREKSKMLYTQGCQDIKAKSVTPRKQVFRFCFRFQIFPLSTAPTEI